MFVLPVFEVESNATVPLNKTELQQMLDDGRAVKFHGNFTMAHKFPKEDEWIAAQEQDEMTIFATVKRQGQFQTWEPFYISSRDIPLFDERLTWELRANKQIHAFVLCLLDFDFHLLSDAFLIHRPGIKTKEETTVGRLSSEGKRLIRELVQPQLTDLYGARNGCIVKKFYNITRR